MRKVAVFLLLAATMVITLGAVQPVSALADTGSPLVIDEVQTGTTNYRHEFVMLYNRTDSAIDLTGHAVVMSDAQEVKTAEVPLSGELVPYGMLYLITESYIEALEAENKAPADYMLFTAEGTHALASSGGHVVLSDSAGQEVDRLGYGSALNPEAVASTELPSNQALKRCSNLQGLSVDTNNNSADFVLIDTPLSLNPGPVCAQQEEEPIEPEVQCSGIVLSEILPNAAGADGGKEFIEIYNPTAEAVELKGCYLQLGSKEYHFADDARIAPGEYRAFYDSATNITLPNSAGGEVMLVTYDTEEIVEYPGGLDDDVAWALAEGEWQQTLKATPNVANTLVKEAVEEAPIGGRGGGLKPCNEGQYRHPDTNRCRKIATEPDLKPCREDQERNPETNRCRSINSASRSLTPCKPGQERNPATNRCRSTATAASSLTPCKPDQFRNPETNRCKKKDSDNGLKPCQEGWERNLETNRCRKKRDAAEAAFAVEETPPSAGSQAGWWAAGAIGTGALGYGVFEWRREIAAGFRKLRGRGGASPESETD